MNSLESLKLQINRFLDEDGVGVGYYFHHSLPKDMVRCKLKIQGPAKLAGLPFFFEVFSNLLGEGELEDGKSHSKLFFPPEVLQHEGRSIDSHNFKCEFNLPFSVAVLGERVALNLLQRMTSIATFTQQFVEKAEKYSIKILDTRKTTPGLRSFEKYAVVLGGGLNHRFNQSDLLMIKDNHKNFFGGVEAAVSFFRAHKGFYTPILVEVDDMDEYRAALTCGVGHILLDNFSPSLIKEVLKIKPKGISLEVSGGISLENIHEYLILGVDAISIGKLTYGAPPIDVSLEIDRI